MKDELKSSRNNSIKSASDFSLSERSDKFDSQKPKRKMKIKSFKRFDDTFENLKEKTLHINQLSKLENIRKVRIMKFPKESHHQFIMKYCR